MRIIYRSIVDVILSLKQKKNIIMTAILASYLTFTSKQSYSSKDRENTKILTLQEKKSFENFSAKKLTK